MITILSPQKQRTPPIYLLYSAHWHTKKMLILIQKAGRWCFIQPELSRSSRAWWLSTLAEVGTTLSTRMNEDEKERQTEVNERLLSVIHDSLP